MIKLKDKIDIRTAKFGAVIFIAYILLHLALGRHKLPAYDSYIFMSFAEHYAENWFTTVIPSQAHGLQIASYPPLLFQVMALLSFIPFLEMTHIYVLLMSAGVAGFSIAFYQLLDELFDIEEKISLLVVLFISFSPGLMKAALVYGQMTFIVGMIFGFTSVRFFYKAIKGERGIGIFLIFSAALTAFTHHLSFLITGLIIGIISLVNYRDTIANMKYLSALGILSGGLVALGLLPMIKEILFGFSQGVIPHGSRHPLQSARVFNNYLTSTYGASILGVWLLFKDNLGTLSMKLISCIFLTIGLGLTTPLPKILFGGFAKILVYTRFSLIASLFLSGMIGVYITKVLSINFLPDSIELQDVLLSIFIFLSILNLFWANYGHYGAYTGYGGYKANQTSTAAHYLKTEASTGYLYVTYFHGPPVDELSTQTDIPTLETGYYAGRKIESFHSFRRLDRLNQKNFKKVIENSDRLSLKYILSFDRSLEPLMNNTEWRKKDLKHSVEVWINKEAPKYRPNKGKKHFLFGTIPILTLFTSAAILYSQKTRNKLEKFIELAQSKIESTQEAYHKLTE